MSNVLIDRQKIDILANAISDKSGVPVTMTLDEMVEAVDGIETGGGTPTLETVTKTYTPSTTAVTDTITPSSGYDGLEEVDVTVSAVPLASSVDNGAEHEFYYVTNNGRRWRVRTWEDYDDGGYISGVQNSSWQAFMAVASGTSITPTESTQTIGGANYMMEGAVTVNAIPSNYVGSGITQRSSSDLTASGATVTVPSGYYSAQASKAVTSGTAGTPTATKGSVSNHSVSVTPSVTNTTGYITGSTINGTAVTVSASELASGNKAITQNGTGIDVVGYSTVSVDVQGGGVTWETIYNENVTIVADTPNYVSVLNFTNPPLRAGQTWRITWDGTSYICPVQVGTDPNQTIYVGNAQLVGYPDDSNEPFFGYMRTSSQLAFVTTDPAGTIPLKMELQQSSSATLIEKTITQNGTYDAEDDDADGYSSVTVNVPSSSPTIQSLTVAPSTSQQSFNSSSVDGYKPVTVSAVSQTNLTADNIKSGTTISISNGQNNLWSVTGTYEGGGGSSDVATGTLTVASNVNTSTSTQITTTTAIGFTPTKFFFWKDARAATSNHVNQATFTTIGSYYIRTMTRYSNNTLSTSGNANNWTTQTAGYLYFNNNTIYFRSSSSYILSSGTWSWVAVK